MCMPGSVSRPPSAPRLHGAARISQSGRSSSGRERMKAQASCEPLDKGPLRVRDVGTAVIGAADTKQAAWADGKRGVFLVVFKQPGANVIDTVDKIMQRVQHDLYYIEKWSILLDLYILVMTPIRLLHSENAY